MAITVREQRIINKMKETEDGAEREKLRKKLEQERQRPRRVRNWTPPKKKKKEILALDFATEEAIEFLKAGNLPVIDHKPVEWSSYHRQIIQEAAKARGWTPPS